MFRLVDVDYFCERHRVHAGLGGDRGSIVFGSTDENGLRVVENRVSVYDLHATILHQLGLDHRELVIVREGRSERLTDEFPTRVVKEILA